MTNEEQIQHIGGELFALKDIIEALVEGIPHANLNAHAVRLKLQEFKQQRVANEHFNQGYRATLNRFLESPRFS